MLMETVIYDKEPSGSYSGLCLGGTLTPCAILGVWQGVLGTEPAWEPPLG